MSPKDRVQRPSTRWPTRAGALLVCGACVAACEEGPNENVGATTTGPPVFVADASVGSGDAGGGSASTTGGQPGPVTSPDAGGGVPGTTGAPPSGPGGLDGGALADAGEGPGEADAAVGVDGGTDGGAAPVGEGEICARWNAAREDLSESPWDGDVASCDPGDMTEDARQRALGLVNLYRSMAGLSPVEMSEEGNRLAQVCALAMRANDRISHSVTESWQCYSADAAEAARTSSVSSGPAVSSVDGYMVDPGNPTTLGHRRWILSNMLAGIGFGSADRFSCQYQPATRPAAGAKAWVAWPSPGQVPIEAFSTRWASIDDTGWSVQSDSISLEGVEVTVTSDGMELPVSVTQLASGYGSRYAIGFAPMGWTTSAGKTYRVTLGGLSTPIEYEVEVVQCE